MYNNLVNALLNVTSGGNDGYGPFPPGFPNRNGTVPVSDATAAGVTAGIVLGVLVLIAGALVCVRRMGDSSRDQRANSAESVAFAPTSDAQLAAAKAPLLGVGGTALKL